MTEQARRRARRLEAEGSDSTSTVATAVGGDGASNRTALDTMIHSAQRTRASANIKRRDTMTLRVPRLATSRPVSSRLSVKLLKSFKTAPSPRSHLT